MFEAEACQEGVSSGSTMIWYWTQNWKIPEAIKAIAQNEDCLAIPVQKINYMVNIPGHSYLDRMLWFSQVLV